MISRIASLGVVALALCAAAMGAAQERTDAGWTVVHASLSKENRKVPFSLEPIEFTPCTEAQVKGQGDQDTLTDGPFRLDPSPCIAGSFNVNYHVPPAFDSRGRHIAELYDDYENAIAVRAIGSSDAVLVLPDAPLSDYLPGRSQTPRPPFTWSRKGDSLLALQGARARPSHFATQPPRPISIALNGAVTPLRALARDGEPLDGLDWIGRDGLALAQFGASQQSDELGPDKRVTSFAFVDTKKGRVRSSITLQQIAAAAGVSRPDFDIYGITDATAVQLGTSRLRAVFAVRGDARTTYVVWTEGEGLRRLLDRDPALPPDGVVLSPDGVWMLVTREIRTMGGRDVEPNVGHVSGQPNEGSLADLYSIADGRKQWSIIRTIRVDQAFPTPSFSPDGREVLIGLPADKAGEKGRVALLDTRSGEQKQLFPAPGCVGCYAYSMGFLDDGRTIWMRIGIAITFYHRETL